MGRYKRRTGKSRFRTIKDRIKTGLSNLFSGGQSASAGSAGSSGGLTVSGYQSSTGNTFGGNSNSPNLSSAVSSGGLTTSGGGSKGGGISGLTGNYPSGISFGGSGSSGVDFSRSYSSGGITSYNTPSTFQATDFNEPSGLASSNFNIASSGGSAGDNGFAGALKANVATATGDVGGIVEEPESDEEKGVDKAQKELLRLMGMEEDRGKDTEKLSREAGVPGLSAELSDLRAKQAMETAQYLSQLEQVQGKPIAMEFIAGQQGELKRRHGIDAMITSALIQSKQGQLQAAQASVQAAIDLKYDEIESRIRTQKQVLEFAYEDLEASDKKLADERKFVLDQQEADLKQFKRVQAEAIDASFAAHLPAGVASQLLQADSYDELSNIANNYNLRVFTSQEPKSPKGVKDGTISIGAAGERTLLSANFTSAEIKTLQEGVSQYGLESVIQAERAGGLGESEIAAIRKAFGGEEGASKVTSIDEFKVSLKESAQKYKDLGFSKKDFKQLMTGQVTEKFGSVPKTFKNAINDIAKEIW